MITAQTILFALTGGILPALFWLWFWLKEDKKRPEPRGLLMLSFFAGMLATILVLPLEKFTAGIFTGTALIVSWSVIEEGLKFIAAYIAVLRRKALDEPIDALIYMITVALGFAALENTLFLINPLIDGNVTGSILTGNLRFLGATLLHILSSATIGVTIALSLFKIPLWRVFYISVGVILSIILHVLFNFFILNSKGQSALLVFVLVWVGVIGLLLIFEKIKRGKKLNRLFIKEE